MTLKLTDEQVIEMAKLAILASSPVGLGFLHHQPNLKKEDITNLEINGGLYVDYYQGRMVKFQAYRVTDGEWSFPNTISYDYQSWKTQYPDYMTLAKEVTK